MSLHTLLKPFGYSQVQVLQQADEYCSQQMNKTEYIGIPKEGNLYLGIANMLFQQAGHIASDRLIIPNALRDHVIRGCHENRDGIHPGRRQRSADDTATCVTNLFHAPGLLRAAAPVN